MKFFYIFSFLFLISCSPTKKVYICGDQKCKNKAEAKKYFKENLSLEIKLINKNKEKSYNLVQLNTIDLNQEKQKRKIFNLKSLNKDNKKIVKKKKKKKKKKNIIKKKK